MVILGGMDDVTQILQAIEAGDQKASAELLPLVYDELRRLAAEKMAHEYLAPGGVATADPWTFVIFNDASTSDDDVFGILI